MMVCLDEGVDGDRLVVRLLDDQMGFLGEGLFCFGFTSDIAIRCSLVEISIGNGGQLHAGDDAIVVAVNDGDLEEVDVAQT